MFYNYKFNKTTYTNGITLPAIQYNPNYIYQKFIITISSAGLTKFISYMPNHKYKDKNWKIKKILKKTYKSSKPKCFNISYYPKEYNILVDFLNDFMLFQPIINYWSEDFCEQKSNNILFYIHKTLLFCNTLIDYSPILSIYCTNILQFCERQLHKYPPFEDININLYKIFSNIFEDLYEDFVSSINEAIEMIDVTFMDYNPQFFKLDIPKQTILLLKKKKEEINKEEISINYKEKFYTEVDTSVQIYELNTTKDFINVCLLNICSNKIPIRKCKNCSNYFISKRRDTIFCKNPSPQNPNRSCSDVRNHLSSKQKEQENTITNLYQKFYNLCITRKKKNSELYEHILNIFKKKFEQYRNKVIYGYLKRSNMIKWLNEIINNPLSLIEEAGQIDKISSSLLENYENIDDFEFKNQLKMLIDLDKKD